MGQRSRDGLSKVFGSTEYMTWASRLGNIIDARKVASEFAGQRKPTAGSKYAQGLIDICRDNPPAGPDPPPDPPTAIPAPFSGRGMVLLEPTGGSEDMNVTKAAGFTYVLLNLAYVRGGSWDTVRQRAAAAGVAVVPWRRVYRQADSAQIEDTATAWGSTATAHNLEAEAMTTYTPQNLATFVKTWPKRTRAVITEPWAQNGAGWHHLADWVGMPESFLNADDRWKPAVIVDHLIAEGIPRCAPMHGWGAWSDAPIFVPPARYLELWPAPRPFAVYFGDSREPQYPEWR